jgi:hypothetical protein
MRKYCRAGGATGGYVATQLSGFRLQLDTLHFGHLIPKLIQSTTFRPTQLQTCVTLSLYVMVQSNVTH